MSFPSHAVIVTAAGSSERFKQSGTKLQKKEFVLIDDRSVLYHAVEPFMQTPQLKAVIVTYAPDYLEETEAALDNLMFAFPVPLFLVKGGQTRQQSVLKALEQLSFMELAIDYVAIHDGARPWVSPELIINTLATATVFGGAAPALIIHDALKKIDEHGCISQHVIRDGIVAIQTPQVFRFPLILDAHRKASGAKKTYVDDTEIFSDFGGMIAICEGLLENRKLTTFADLNISVTKVANQKDEV